MTTAQEIDATLDDLKERTDETADRIEELAGRVKTLADDLGTEPTRPDVKPVERADLESLLSAPDKRTLRRLQARLSALEEHMAHRGPGPCPCARCGWLRLKNGEGPPPEAFHRGSVTFAEDDDQ